MKKNFKKIISAVVGVALITSSMTVYATTSNNTLSWAESTEDSYSIIVDGFAQKPYYSGAYIKDELLYISTTDISASKAFLSELSYNENLPVEDTSNVKFNEVKYTYDELVETSDYFIKNSESLNVIGTYTDPENNTVVIETNGVSTYTNYIFNDCAKFDNVVIDPVGEVEIYDDSTYLRGGYRIINSTQGTAFSLGCGIKWSDTGEYGFLTAAHDSVKTKDVFKYNGVEFGTVYAAQNSGSIDAELIKRTNTSYRPSNKNGASGIVCTQSGTAIVGEKVTLFGQTTGSSDGKIVAIDYTSTSGLTNLIKTTCTSASGDSGGALIAIRSTGNVFVGINKGHFTSSSGSVYEVATKWTEIRDTYNVTRLYATES